VFGMFGGGKNATDASRDKLHSERACSTLFVEDPGQRHPSAGYHEKTRHFSTTSKLASEAKYHMLNAEVMSPRTLTYLLTPWSRVLLEKVTGSAASQEIPRIFETRRFITVLTSARHLSLS